MVTTGLGTVTSEVPIDSSKRFRVLRRWELKEALQDDKAKTMRTKCNDGSDNQLRCKCHAWMATSSQYLYLDSEGSPTYVRIANNPIDSHLGIVIQLHGAKSKCLVFPDSISMGTHFGADVGLLTPTAAFIFLSHSGRRRRSKLL